jgi:hypothetical protein
MKVWVVLAKVEEIEASSIDKVFNSIEKADKYIKEQQMNEILPNLSGFEHTIEEWEVE